MVKKILDNFHDRFSSSTKSHLINFHLIFYNQKYENISHVQNPHIDCIRNQQEKENKVIKKKRAAFPFELAKKMKKKPKNRKNSRQIAHSGHWLLPSIEHFFTIGTIKRQTFFLVPLHLLSINSITFGFLFTVDFLLIFFFLVLSFSSFVHSRDALQNIIFIFSVEKTWCERNNLLLVLMKLELSEKQKTKNSLIFPSRFA